MANLREQCGGNVDLPRGNISPSEINDLRLALRGNRYKQPGPKNETFEEWVIDGQKALVSITSLQDVSCIYSPLLELRKDLGGFPTRESVLSKARSEGSILVISGFSTSGYDYSREEEALQKLFASLHGVSLVVHGGTRSGVPALAHLSALEQNIPDFGIMPFTGLKRIAYPSPKLLQVENYRFGEETEALGSTADVLVAFGGGQFTKQEIEAAQRNNAIILGYNPPENPYPKDATVNQLRDQLIVCQTIDELISQTNTALTSKKDSTSPNP